MTYMTDQIEKEVDLYLDKKRAKRNARLVEEGKEIPNDENKDDFFDFSDDESEMSSDAVYDYRELMPQQQDEKEEIVNKLRTILNKLKKK